MEPPDGPQRFKCPLDFSPSPFCPGPPFSQEVLQDPSKELWLIRAPANFSPESLDGRSVPLQGFRTLKASQPGGTKKTFHIQTSREHLGGAVLLIPSGDHLSSSPPLSGSLSISERYEDPSGSSQPLLPLAAKPAPQIPAGLKQRFLPFGNNPGRAAHPGAAEEIPRKKKKKKKKKHQAGEAEEGSEDRLPLFGVPLGEKAGAGCQHQGGGAAPLGVGCQPSSAALVQNGHPSGEAEAPLPFSKKRKRKEDIEVKEEAWGEAEDEAAPLPMHSQPSFAAEAQNGHPSSEAEDTGSRSKKKKRKKEKELKEEAEDGAAPWAMHSQPSSAADAQKGLFSGDAEELGSGSKKKKRKKERKLKEEELKEAEDWAAPLAMHSQLSSAAEAQNGILPGEAEDPGSRSKKKKRKKEKELKEEAEDGAAPWAMDSQPSSAADAQKGLFSGDAEELGSGSKKKKKRKEREVKEEAGGGAGAVLQQEGAAPSSPEAPPDSAAFAHSALLSGEVQAAGPRSKKEKRKEGGERKGEVEEAPVGEITLQPNPGPASQGGLLSGGPRSERRRRKEGGEGQGEAGLAGGGEDRLPGLGDVAQATCKGESKAKAVPAEPLSSQEGAAGAWGGFSGLQGPAPEGGLALEEPEAGATSHKAKKKKRKKPEGEEAAREQEGQPAQQGVGDLAELGTPLGGGGGQEVEPSREKRKKKGHRRREAALEGLGAEVGNS